MSEAEILAAALALPKETRAEVVLRLVDSLDESPIAALSEEDWEAAALAEILRRRSGLRDGRLTRLPAAEAFEVLRARLALDG